MELRTFLRLFRQLKRQPGSQSLLVHGRQDHFIPIEEARRVRNANPAWVALWEVAAAGHVTAATLWPGEYQRRILGWFDSD